MSETSTNDALHRRLVFQASCGSGSKVFLLKVFCAVIFSLVFIGFVIALVTDQDIQEDVSDPFKIDIINEEVIGEVIGTVRNTGEIIVVDYFEEVGGPEDYFDEVDGSEVEGSDLEGPGVDGPLERAIQPPRINLKLSKISSAQSSQSELQQALTENYTDDVSPQVLRLQNIASRIMEKRVNETSEEDANELLRLLGKRGGVPGLRMIGQTGTLFNSIVNFKDIAEYGCWCKLAEAGKGWGTPMDEIDSACKVFQHCRRCIQLEDDGSGCDPVEQSYAIGPYFSGDDIGNQCTIANPSDNCAQQTCSCEVQFVSQLMGILFSFGNGYTQNFNHNDGFSVDQTCKIWISGEKNWECCGTFPEIMPYNTYDKFCCHDTLPHDPDYQVCCDDGSVNYYSNPCSTGRKRRSIVDKTSDFYNFVQTSHFYEG